MKKLFTIKGIIAAVAVMFALSLTSCNKDDKTIKVTKIEFKETKLEITVGEKVQLNYTITPSDVTNKEVTFESGNKKVATVSTNGEVKGISKGEATITVKAKDGSGKQATCKVTVVDKGGSDEGGENGGDQKILVETITIKPTTIGLYVGDTFQLDVTVFPANASDKTLTWTSSSDNVTVDSSGKITAVKEGSAIITATAKDGSGVKATCTVNCKEENLDYKSEYTQTDYYMWDAYKPYENITTGTWGEGSAWYNPTTRELASASCKDCPTAQQIVAYLKAGVYWDDNTTVAEGKKTYTLDGKTTESYSTGLWVKKRRYIDNFDSETEKRYPTTPKRLSTLGKEEVIKIRTNGEYFFLPACGNYNNSNSGSLSLAGTGGGYWSSTPNTTYANGADRLYFSSDKAYVSGYDRSDGVVPMPRL